MFGSKIDNVHGLRWAFRQSLLHFISITPRARLFPTRLTVRLTREPRKRIWKSGRWIFARRVASTPRIGVGECRPPIARELLSSARSPGQRRIGELGFRLGSVSTF